MYYLLLVVGVVSLLALAAWLLLAQRGRLAAATDLPWPAAAGTAPGDAVARLLKGERKEDKPCLTPIDCVAANRCAGHCGCR